MNNNTTSFGEYIWDNLFYAVIGFIWYKNLLLRCLNDMSYGQSRIVLLSMIIVIGTFGIIVNIGRNRNGSSTFANIAFPFGTYTALAYVSVNRLLFLVVSICAGVISALFAGMIMCRRSKNKKKAGPIFLNCIRQVISQTQFIFAVGLTCAMVILGIGTLVGSSILQPTVIATTYKESDEQTIENNIDVVLQLQEDVWDDLSAQERLDILQTIANIERRYLGIPHELNVSVANIGEYLLGCYDDKKHTITISLDSLMNDPADKVLNTVCHEAYHGYQHCIVSVLESTSEEAKNLRLFRDARNYAEEFSDYKSGGQGFYDYYYQECEMDAREYAEDAVFDYYKRIEEYLFENKQ